MIYIGANNTGLAATPGLGKHYPLFGEDRAYWGASWATDITYLDLTSISGGIATATAQILGLASVGTGNGQLISLEAMRLLTPFANANNAAQNSTQIQVGDNESATQFLASTELNLNGAYVQVKAGATNNVKAYTAADILQVNFVAPAAGQTLSNLTQGWVRLYWRIRDNNLPA
jgi:hypothetical protein